MHSSVRLRRAYYGCHSDWLVLGSVGVPANQVVQYLTFPSSNGGEFLLPLISALRLSREGWRLRIEDALAFQLPVGFGHYWGGHWQGIERWEGGNWGKSVPWLHSASWATANSSTRVHSSHQCQHSSFSGFQDPPTTPPSGLEVGGAPIRARVHTQLSLVSLQAAHTFVNGPQVQLSSAVPSDCFCPFLPGL